MCKIKHRIRKRGHNVRIRKLHEIYNGECCKCGQKVEVYDKLKREVASSVLLTRGIILYKNNIDFNFEKVAQATVEHLIDVLHPDANKIENVRLFCWECNQETAKYNNCTLIKIIKCQRCLKVFVKRKGRKKCSYCDECKRFKGLFDHLQNLSLTASCL